MRGRVFRKPRLRWALVGLCLAACGGKANRSSDDGTGGPSSGGSAATATGSVGNGASTRGSGGAGGVGGNRTSASEVVSVTMGGSSSGGRGSGGGAGEHNYLPWDEACPDLSEQIASYRGECGSIAVHHGGDPSDDCTVDVAFDFGNSEPKVAIDCELLAEVPLGEAGASATGWGWASRDERQVVLVGEACESVQAGVERVDVVFLCALDL